MIETENIPTAVTTSRPKKRPMNPQAGMQGLINLALMVWMIWDLRHRRDEEINGRRKLWLLAAFAPPIGPIAYLIFGRKRQPKPTEIPLEIPEEL
jgi:hypothetical protein